MGEAGGNRSNSPPILGGANYGPEDTKKKKKKKKKKKNYMNIDIKKLKLELLKNIREYLHRFGVGIDF